MQMAVKSEEARVAIESLAATWCRIYPRKCDWCRGTLRGKRDLREYLDWCLQLGTLLQPTEKRLPEPKVFCNNCALTAIPELLGTAPADEVPF